MPLARPLDAVEQRVVGSLVEKELSTPDAYPLTLNALIAACNQSSNRDPVTRLTAAEIDAALLRLMGDLLVWRDRGGRALRWRHSLDEKVGLSAAEKAVIAELLLRGPQTPGELRSRSPRMHAFGSLGEVESTLAALADRRLVLEQPRLPGQKERRWRHLMGDGAVPTVMAAQRSVAPQPERAEGDDDSATRGPVSPPSPLSLEERVAELERRVRKLMAVVARLSGD
jgi:uncharacterized protein YceH (UPF0502 family)